MYVHFIKNYPFFPADRGTCILFGDGSGAVVLEATDSEEDSGLLGFALHSRGEGYENLQLRFKGMLRERSICKIFVFNQTISLSMYRCL